MYRLLDTVGSASAKDIANKIREKVKIAIEEPEVVRSIGKLIVWYACKSSNAILSQLFAEIIFDVVFQLSNGPGKDALFDALKDVSITPSQITEISGRKWKVQFQKILSHSLLISQLYKLNEHYFGKAFGYAVSHLEQDTKKYLHNDTLSILNVLRFYVMFVARRRNYINFKRSITRLMYEKDVASLFVSLEVIYSRLNHPYYKALLDIILLKRTIDITISSMDNDFLRKVHSMVCILWDWLTL